MRRAALALGLAAGFGVRAAPAPPPVPEGIADARGQLGFFRAKDRGVAAVDLSTGEIRWSSSEGVWPLYASLEVVAVAAPDPRVPGALRVRFLRLSDGRRLVESEPIALRKGLGIPDPRTVPDRTTPGFTVAGWAPPLARTPGEKDGRLRVRWEWSFTPAYGIRPPSPPETQRASGVVRVEPQTGRVTPGSDDERPAIPQAEMPPAFRPDPQLLYWSFSEHGASWSSAPTSFWIGGGVQGALVYEPRGDRRLTLLRWRPDEPLQALPLAQGAEYAPAIALGGRFVALSEQKDRRERVLLHDLLHPAAPLAELPPFGRLCRPPFAILGDRMLCIREREGEPIEGGTAFGREVVSIRYRTGEQAWSVELPPRLLAAPVAGGRILR